MIDQIVSKINRLPLPDPVKAQLTCEIAKIPDATIGVSQQNGVVCRACGVVKAMISEPYASAICGQLYPLCVGVDYKTVKGAIRRNRNQPVTIYPDTDDVIEVTP
jgi:hypothetical protein